jgi:hypothetical protein
MLVLLLMIAIPLGIWFCLSHEPDFYRALESVPRERRKTGARQFVAQSMQLRNDIINEGHWEAVFSDQEVNAWLAEDLVTQFADQIPSGVREPRVAFEPDRAILAFRLDDSPFRSVIWVVMRVRVPEANLVALTIEKIRAGVLPVPADQVLERIAQHARERGIDVRWEHEDGLPVAMIRYHPHLGRRDVVLEQFQILDGYVRLIGRSEATGELAQFGLPSGRFLQANFPRRRNVHRSAGSGRTPASFLRSSTSPES